MNKFTAAIRGVHGYVPDHVLSNTDLEKMVETNDEWIRSRTGIHERRILKEEGKGTSHMAIKAVNGLLEKTGTDPKSIDLLICGTVTADYVFPDTANAINYQCGLSNAFGYDINAACSGFLFSLVTASKFIETGAYKKVIVVGADMMSSIVDYTDRATCIIFGDGAGAVLLEADEEGYGIQDSILKSDGSGQDLLYMKAGGSKHPATAETLANREHYAWQDGRSVFKFAVKGMSSVVKELIEKNNISKEDLAWLVPHQANARILNAVADYIDFPMEKVMMNIHKYGNTTSATIPLCLWEWEDQLKKDDQIILTAFGGGFTWGSILVKWAY